MPVHDWTRVPDGIYHDFHTRWLTHLKEALNGGILPEVCYAISEQDAVELDPDVMILRGLGFMVSEADGELNRGRRGLIICHVSDDRILARMEIITPCNKASRNPFRTFVEKRLGAIDAGINLLIVDLFPPSDHDPQGIHWAIWQEIDNRNSYTPPADKPLTLAAYAHNPLPTAYIQPVAVGDVLIDMPLFLDPVSYVKVPLEATYQMTWRGVPRRWREVLEAPPAS